MVTQISLAIIAIALVTLVVFLIIAVLKVRKAIEHLSSETSGLIARVNELTTDITKKSQSLNFLFAPLTHFNLDGPSSENKTLPQLVEWVATSLILVKKSKEFIKKYAK